MYEIGFGEMLILVDVGVVFGIGYYGIILGCMEVFVVFVKSFRFNCVLDLGLGLGILVIVVVKLWYMFVFVIDIDFVVVCIVYENVKVNGVVFYV